MSGVFGIAVMGRYQHNSLQSLSRFLITQKFSILQFINPGTIFNNKLIENLKVVLPTLPTAIDISTIRNSGSKIHELPESIKGPIIHAFVNAMSSAYMFLIPMGIICFIASWFSGNIKPSKKEEMEESNRKSIKNVVAFHFRNMSKLFQ